jgi:polar amino acid transport system substrate-binding protein
MAIDLARKSLLGKAQARPDLVRRVVNMTRRDGLLATIQTVRSKLEQVVPLGYSAAGVVEAVAEGVTDFKPGDRIALAGVGYATHAETNFVPNNLAVPIPPGVDFEEASFTTVGSIALQGVRLARPELGDVAAVVGLGLVGLLTTQILQANGCRVVGFDPDPDRVKLGLELGMEAGGPPTPGTASALVDGITGGRGADCTFITAATKRNDPIVLSGDITRRKGRVVVVGAVGLDIPRDSFYQKELDLQISMSYGPGRYDPSYEEGGIDYPYEYVRWTERRNMSAVLQLMAQGKLATRPLTTHRFPITEALDAYSLIEKQAEPFLAVVLEYAGEKKHSTVVELDPDRKAPEMDSVGVSFVGAGNYASSVLIPELKKTPNVSLQGVVAATGANAHAKASQFQFRFASTELDAVLEDGNTAMVFEALHACGILPPMPAGGTTRFCGETTLHFSCRTGANQGGPRGRESDAARSPDGRAEQEILPDGTPCQKAVRRYSRAHALPGQLWTDPADALGIRRARRRRYADRRDVSLRRCHALDCRGIDRSRHGEGTANGK